MNATVASAAFAASANTATSEWIEGPEPASSLMPLIKMSDQARSNSQNHSVQQFGGDEWVEPKTGHPSVRPEPTVTPATASPGGASGLEFERGPSKHSLREQLEGDSDATYKFHPQLDTDSQSESQSPSQAQSQWEQSQWEQSQGGQAEAAGSAHPFRAAPLQGGVVSSVNNFGPKGNPTLQGLGDQAAFLMDLHTHAKPSFPTPVTVRDSLFKNWLQQTHGALKATDKNAIVEIKGQWDDSQHILHYFGLLSSRINPNVVNKFDFSHSYVAIVDCAGNLNQDAIEALRSFVWNGGYLVSTDWALDNFLVRAFPGVMEWNGGYSYPDLVDAFCVDLDTDYLKGCVPSARWKLDDKCQTIKIVRPEYVHVLVRSNDLSRQDPDGIGVLAASFQYGRGQVLHVVGHFDINSAGTFTNSLPDPAPRIGIGLRQAIIANFIVKGLQVHNMSSPDKGTATSDQSAPDDEPMDK